MSKGAALLVRSDETEFFDVDYSDPLAEAQFERPAETVLANLVADRRLAQELARRLAPQSNTHGALLHVTSPEDARLVMGATDFVPAQEFRLDEYLDDEG